ncbi:Putative zn(2)Cys(6) fungal-type DNA-binding domain, Zinc finger C2H2-type [Colletotrichum destructivum]|uniref:Zn(2)Cys(6) fungal-type DNA-binding domain, Zinc finger C2H2-type n=1 Tax=Colletotrichum destructivum TaxID=34406 RepID=A0AAX4I7A8_9PEZI|nr:Putative zn(2)Cys(6) fungal-type DNA-binding domain, Zinc finger C2H2-type [Colletotrichum destructivum]
MVLLFEFYFIDLLAELGLCSFICSQAVDIQIARYKCLYCEKAFARRDVCRKHTVHCPNKHDQETLPNLKRGQKPRACDACFHSKQSCDTSDPCERCVSRKLPCTYRRLEEATSSSVTIGADSAPSSLSTGTTVGVPNNDKDRTKITVAFLLGLTNPNSDNILEFLANEAASRTEGEGTDPNMRPTPPQYPPSTLIDEDFTFLPYGFASSFAPEFMDFQSLETLSTDTLPSTTGSPFDPESWSSRAADIVSDLHNVHNNLREIDPWYDGSFNLETAESVFSAENLCNFATTYFRVSHLDFPIVHRPDFGTERTNKLLLLAVGLSGSLRSPPSDDVLAARGFLSLAEEYIFRGLNRLMPPGSAPEFTIEVQETFQAALMIHCVQFFRNDIASRRKNRTQRLPVLVSAVRCLGLAQVRHAPIFQYEDFVLNETKIRLAIWTALGDWQQSGMFNSPPLMTPAELTCDLPSPLELWDAKNSTEYFEAAHALGLDGSRRISSVKHCIDALMRDTWSGIGSFPFQDINGLDLQVLIFGISGMVLSANLMGILPTSAQALLRAVSRWETMWETIRGRMDPAAFEKIGMIRFNSELCWAARKIVQVAISGDKSSAYMQKVGHDSLVQLHEFVRQYRDS